MNSAELEIFDDALQIPDRNERSVMLDRACAGDPGLRERIEELLAASGQADQFFTDCITAVATSVEEFGQAGQAAQSEHGSVVGDLEEPIGSQIGPYKLLRKIGEGGCGVVYQAEQETPIRRQVALKIIKPGMDTKSVIARFEAEQQALALMDHPNIARVLDAGATRRGRPFFVMELVHGVRLTQFCDEHRFNTRQRLQLFIQVCHAIQHAHQKGIVHRDIKPSNILVTQHDNLPVPKVIDFGIAKAMEERLRSKTELTMQGLFVGTPAYMSPEQMQLSGLDVDTRSDIYSLGVLLYELLTGKTPFDQSELMALGWEAMRRTVCDRDPCKPSARLDSLLNTELTVTAQRRQIEPPKLRSELRGDLDWVVMKALEKDRNRRYQTANGLALDVQRFLDNESVIARPPSRLYRLQKLVRRNQVVFASGAMVALTLVVGLGVSTRLYLRERAALKEEAWLRQEAEQARANEMRLRQKAEAREKVTEAGVLSSHHKMQEADELLEQVPADLFSPSMEATTVFRELGIWNTLEGNWKQAAGRFTVLVQVNQVDKADQTDAATCDLLWAAPLLIEAGDLAGYDRIRRMELLRLAGTSNLIAAEQLIKTSLLVPADSTVLKLLDPLAKLVADSQASNDPKINDGSFYAAWRAVALALREYRRGDFPAAAAWLDKCAGYPGQTPSCVATMHVLLGLDCIQLGQIDRADTELIAGRRMIQSYFDKKLEVGDNKTGLLQGWLMARILLREAEKLSPIPP